MTTQQFLTTTLSTEKSVTWAQGVRRAFARLVAAGIVLIAAATPAAAQVFDGVPIRVEDDGDEAGAAGRTLRQAIAEAQATPDDDVIVFADGISEIQLTQGQLLIGHLFMPPDSGWLMIDGGEEGVVIDAGGESGVMSIESGSVILTGLGFTNGDSDLGGGLMIWDGTEVFLDNSLVALNTASTAGGGIYNAGALTMTDTLVSDNYSNGTGGGVHVNGAFDGSLAADNSEFSDNEARSAGGGILNDEAVVTLINATISGNTARNGGGIYNYVGPLSFSGGDLSGNQADRKGNDIYYTTGSVSGDLTGLDVYEEQPKGKGGGRR